VGKGGVLVSATGSLFQAKLSLVQDCEPSWVREEKGLAHHFGISSTHTTRETNRWVRCQLNLTNYPTPKLAVQAMLWKANLLSSLGVRKGSIRYTGSSAHMNLRKWHKLPYLASCAVCIRWTETEGKDTPSPFEGITRGYVHQEPTGKRTEGSCRMHGMCWSDWLDASTHTSTKGPKEKCEISPGCAGESS